MHLPISRLAVATLLTIGLRPAMVNAQFSSCGSPVEEIDPVKNHLYQIFDDLYLRLESSKITITPLTPGLLNLIANSLQTNGNTGRWQPHFGKCDPTTDRSIYDIQQLFPSSQSTISGGAMAGGGGSTSLLARAAMGASLAGDDVVVGFADAGNFTPFHAFRWTLTGGMADLGTLDPANNATRTSMATATSADGNVVVGFSEIGGGIIRHAFRWTSAGGMVDMGAPAGASRDSRATGISAAGDVIVGEATFADNTSFTGFRNGAFRWTAATGFRDLGALAPGFFSIATRVSADGNVIVGQGGVEVRVGNTSTNGSRAFRWTNATGMQAIGPLPGHTHAVATGVSDNGKVVVGISSIGPLSFNPVLRYGSGTAFIWTETAGIKELRQVMIDQGFQMTGVSLVTASAISQDGQYIVGDAVGPRTPAGETRPYLIKLCDAANGVPCTPFQTAPPPPPPPPTPDFAFATTSPTAVTVIAGQNVTANLTVTPTGGFSQQVTFNCAGLPATTACVFAPATVTPSGAAITTTLTISTAAPTRAVLSVSMVGWSGGTGNFGFVVLMALLIVGVRFATRRRALVATIASIGLITSCGGGNGDVTGEPPTSQPPLTGGTAAGTYPIVVTATTGSGTAALSKTLSITMTVTR